MSHPTDTWPPQSPVAAAVDAYLAPVARHLSTFTAARAVARFLVDQEELATDERVHFFPRSNGDVSVTVTPHDPDTLRLAAELAAALGAALKPTPFSSPGHGRAVSLTLYSAKWGAEWLLTSAVAEAEWATFDAARAQADAA